MLSENNSLAEEEEQEHDNVDGDGLVEGGQHETEKVGIYFFANFSFIFKQFTYYHG